MEKVRAKVREKSGSKFVCLCVRLRKHNCRKKRSSSVVDVNNKRIGHLPEAEKEETSSVDRRSDKCCFCWDFAVVPLSLEDNDEEDSEFSADFDTFFCSGRPKHL